MSLLAVGSVAFDDLESPSGHKDHLLGGSVTYFSLCASHFHPVQVVGVVGEDFGEAEYAVFHNRPIDLKGLVRKAGRSFHWKGVYGQDLNEAKTLETHLNVFADWQVELPEAYRDAKYLFLGNIDPVLQKRVLTQMSKRPEWVALDTMNFWIGGSLSALREVLREVDILLVNEAELRELTGERNLLVAFEKIQEFGPSILVVKRGEYGVSLFSKAGVFMAPAFPLSQVMDPTGAGDTFAGGFLGYLASKGDLEWDTLKQACVYGTVMASFTVEKFGTERLREVMSNDISARIKAFSSMIRVNGL